MIADPADPSQLACPVLLELDERFVELEEEIVELLTAGDEAALHCAPGPGRWSAAQSIDHLTRSLEATLPAMTTAVERGRTRSILGAAPYGRGTFPGRWLLAILEAPVGRGVPAPRRFRPAAEPGAAPELAHAFAAAQGRVRSLLRAADGLALGRLRLATPVSPLLRVTLAQAFRIHVAHEARHRVQAWQALRAAGVPGLDR